METMISSELRKYEANIVDKTNKLRKIFENSKWHWYMRKKTFLFITESLLCTW